MKEGNKLSVTSVKPHPVRDDLVIVTWNGVHSVANKNEGIEVGDIVTKFEKQRVDYFGVVSEAIILETENESINDGVRSSEGESGEDPRESSEGHDEWEAKSLSSEDTGGSMGDGAGEEIDWDPDQY